MSLIQRMCKQYAVYWAPGAPDAFGQPTYTTDPIELKCRWDELAEVFVDKQGREAVSRAVVYVLQDVAIDGFLWLGRLADVPSQTHTAVTNAFMIRSFNKIRKLSRNQFVRIARL